MYYEEQLDELTVASNTLKIRAVTAEGESVLIPIGLVGSGSAASEYAGKAYLATDPGTPTSNVYWICQDNGEYLHFPGGGSSTQTARQFDRLYWNGAYWDLIPYGSALDVRFVIVEGVIKQQYWTGTAWADTGSEQSI